MSAYLRPRWAGEPTRLQLTRVGVPVNPATINNAFTLLEGADAQNLKVGREPQFPAMLLQASDGSTWRLTLEVDAPGQAQPVMRWTLVEAKVAPG